MITLLKQKLSYQLKLRIHQLMWYHLIKQPSKTLIFIYTMNASSPIFHLLQKYIVICIVKKRQDVAREAGGHVRNFLMYWKENLVIGHKYDLVQNMSVQYSPYFHSSSPVQ